MRFDSISQILKNSPELNTEPIPMKIATNLAWVPTIRWQLKIPPKVHYWRKKSPQIIDFQAINIGLNWAKETSESRGVAGNELPAPELV